MHSMCIKVAIEAGEISDALSKAPDGEDKGVVTGGSATELEKTDGNDDSVVSDPENGNWSGKVHWMKLG